MLDIIVNYLGPNYACYGAGGEGGIQFSLKTLFVHFSANFVNFSQIKSMKSLKYMKFVFGVVDFTTEFFTTEHFH